MINYILCDEHAFPNYISVREAESAFSDALTLVLLFSCRQIEDKQVSPFDGITLDDVQKIVSQLNPSSILTELFLSLHAGDTGSRRIREGV